MLTTEQGWQVATKTISGMLTEIDRFAADCIKGTEENLPILCKQMDLDFQELWREIWPQVHEVRSKLIVNPQGEFLNSQVLDTLLTNIQSEGRELSQRLQEAFVSDLVMRHFLLSSRDTVYSQRALLASFLTNDDHYNIRGFFVLQRDLAEKFLDFPYLCRDATQRALQYYRFTEWVEGTQQDRLANRITKEEENKNLGFYKDEYGSAWRCFPGGWEKRLNQGFLWFLKEGNLYDLDFMGRTRNQIAELLREKFPLFWKISNVWVHGTTIRSHYLQATREKDAHPDIWLLTGPTIFMLYIIAIHCYEQFGRTFDIGNLKAPIETHWAPTGNSLL